MALNVRKGDTVLVIAGKDKGKSGKVLEAMPADNSVVVAGVNMITKHNKPKSAQDKGGIVKKEGKVDASNVQLICPVCNKATRVNHKVDGDNKYRQCKKCGANIDASTKKESKKSTTKDTKPAKSTAVKNDAKVETKVETKKAEPKKAEKAEKSATKTTQTKATSKTSEKVEKPTEKKTSTTAKKTTAAKSTSATKKSTSTKKVESK